jgi:hypothetical protein
MMTQCEKCGKCIDRDMPGATQTEIAEANFHIVNDLSDICDECEAKTNSAQSPPNPEQPNDR